MSVHSHNSPNSLRQTLVPPRILIAEDDELQGQVLRETLIARGYHADIVGNGVEAVRCLCQGGYDLALIDYHLPEVDGLAAACLTQDLVRAESRPRMIAVTAAESGLRDRQLVFGMAPFDSVVSKQNGLPALLTTIDASLSDRAALQHAAHGRQVSQTRRRRWNAVLAALPALTMVALFVTAIGWTRGAVQRVDAAIGSAQHLATLSADAGALTGAVADTEAAQRSYLATGNPQHRELFEADLQHVGRLLAAPASMTSDGTPGFGPAGAPAGVIEHQLAKLQQEAQSRDTADVSPQDAQDTAAWLRAWAASLVSGAEMTLVAGLVTAHRNVVPVLFVLGFGVLYGLWSAALVAHRHWHHGPTLMPAAGLPPSFHPQQKAPGMSGLRARAMLLFRRRPSKSLARPGSRPLRAK